MCKKEAFTRFLALGCPMPRSRTSSRRMVGVASLAISLLLATAVKAGEPSLNTVRQQLDEMLAAANAHDTDRFMAVYSHTSNLVLIFDDQKIIGWRAARDQQEKWWNKGKTDAAYALRSPVEIAQVAKDVIVTFQRLASTMTGAGGAKKTTNLNATSVWRKEPDGWKIVIAHESFVE